MKRKYPKIQCSCRELGLKSGRWVRNGSFYRRSDYRWVVRWRCVGCRKTVSQATGHPCFGQNKRQANEPLRKLLVSGVSMRRAARLLRLHRTTVARKLEFLGLQAQKSHARFMERLAAHPLHKIQFDEMETFEHTKLKPLSIALAVTNTRKILAFEVAQMPAKGLLAAKSRKKYGYRADHRPKAISRLFETLKPLVDSEAVFESDQNPHYPTLLKRYFPKAQHLTTPGGRGCVVGQGELKALKWDPLFSLNHTAAMLRANVNRLFRRTWCTTKLPLRLSYHLWLYVQYHNQTLTA